MWNNLPIVRANSMRCRKRVDDGTPASTTNGGYWNQGYSKVSEAGDITGLVFCFLILPIHSPRVDSTAISIHERWLTKYIAETLLVDAVAAPRLFLTGPPDATV